MATRDVLTALAERNKNFKECAIYQCVIVRHDKSEIWIKKPGEDISDYEVVDRIIAGNYSFEQIWQVPIN